jgi:hypothetical protein
MPDESIDSTIFEEKLSPQAVQNFAAFASGHFRWVSMAVLQGFGLPDGGSADLVLPP